MKALKLFADQTLNWVECDIPSLGEHDVLVQIQALTLNHLDLFSYRGMAFAKRSLPITVGAEGVGRVSAVGAGVAALWLNKRVAIAPGSACGQCKNCLSGKDNVCLKGRSILGFQRDGVAAEFIAVPSHLLVEIPDNVSWEDASCAPITFATVHHMLVDNAQLTAGERILVHAGGSGIGSVAIRMAKHIGAEVFTTVGSDEKVKRARALNADHVINYSNQSFSREIRKITDKVGVDVVFEHVGTDTWEDSMLVLRESGRLVTCGSTTGLESKINLFLLFNKQLKIQGSFGGTLRNIRQSLELMSSGAVLPVIDSVYSVDNFMHGLDKLKSRNVFGKIVLFMNPQD